MSQRNKAGAQQCGGAFAILAKQGVSGKSGKNQGGKTGNSRNQNSSVFMLPASQRQAKGAERNNGPKQPDMESLIAQKRGADGRKNPDHKWQCNAVKGADGRRRYSEFISQSDIFHFYCHVPKPKLLIAKSLNESAGIQAEKKTRHKPMMQVKSRLSCAKHGLFWSGR